MAEPVLNCPRVVARIGQRIAAGVPEHVHVNLKREAGTFADAFDQAIDCIGCKRGTALGLEQKGLLSGLVGSVCFRGRSSIVSQFV